MRHPAQPERSGRSPASAPIRAARSPLERALTELLQGPRPGSPGRVSTPGFDRDEVASAPNIEIHFVDSSGIVAWDFLGEAPDFAFHDWNFSTTTADDYAWLCRRIHADGHDIYVADFEHLGVHACRILVPGMSEIYPVGRPGMGEQQRRQPRPPGHPAPCRTRRRRMRRTARRPQRP